MSASLGLDHVYVRVRHLEPLLAFLHGGLGLPLSWPVREESFARYAWVNAGNVQLELWQARSNDDLPPGMPLPSFAGLALWPRDVHESRQALARQGIGCKEPRTWRTPAPDGQEATNFTNCLVNDASSGACQVFFCQWDAHAPIAPWTKGESTAARRARFASTLADLGGGTLGLTGLSAIHMESPDPAHSARVWSALTGAPAAAAPGVSLHHSVGAEIRIAALVFGVADLLRADSALRSLGANSTSDADVLWIDSAATSGLRIGLMEARSTSG